MTDENTDETTAASEAELRELHELSAAETASLLGTSVASVNSLVQRARSHLRRRHAAPTAPSRADAEERELVRRYVAAHHDGDAETILAMLADDVRVSMPPEAPCIGRDAAAAFFRAVVGHSRPGEWLLVPVRANGRPATANYLRRPGEAAFTATSLDVLDARDGRLVTVHCFLGSGAFAAFGLSETQDPPRVVG